MFDRGVGFWRRAVVRGLLLPLVLACVGAATPTPEASSTVPPDVAKLRAKIEAAQGTLPVSERILVRYDEDGRSSTRVTVRVGKDERIRFSDGPFHSESGTFGGQAWHQNENGLTVLDEPSAGGEADEKRTLTLSHATTPIEADVIADLDPKGNGTKTFVEPATSRIVRFERMTPNETYVTTYEDFRRTDGYERPWHERTTDGQAIDTEDLRVVTVETANITPADVAIAPPRRALVTFPQGTPTVKLPVRLDSEHHWIVRVQVGSRGLDFILDTGASGIVLDEGVARSLGLKLYTQGSNASNAGRYVESATIVPEMDVGPLKMTDVAVSVIPSMRFDDPQERSTAVGLLGFDFIASQALSLDYEHATVTATDYDAFAPPVDPGAIAVPIRVGNEGPETDVWLNGRLVERFEIDTGGVGGVMITDLFTRRYPGITQTFDYGGQEIAIQGVGGTFMARAYSVPEMRIGTTTFKRFSAIVIGSDRMYAGGGFDGIVGPELLQYFTVTTDYADSTLYLLPNNIGRQARTSGPTH